MHRIKLALGLVMTLGIAQVASACVAHAGVSGEVVVADPQVVHVAPGVWVVENHHTAVFYADGHYWRRSGATWYRSSYYDDGFVVVHSRFVPRPIFGVRSHRSYVRYRARRNARRARAVRRHNRGVKRNNRAVKRNNRAVKRNNRRAVKRDNRANRRHNRAVKRNNRRAVKRDNRANRRAVKRDNRKQKRAKVRDNRKNKRKKNNKKKKREKVRDYRR